MLICRRTCLRFISTQLIKRSQKEIQKKENFNLQHFPKTFNQKIQLINDPKAIQAIEIIQYGVKYKKGKLSFIFLLLALAFLLEVQEKFVPIHIIDKYFRISTSSDNFAAKIFAGFKFEDNFYLYTPLLAGIYQMTRFIPITHILFFIFCNNFTNAVFAKQKLKQKVSKYEVWDLENLSFGEGTWISLPFLFWSALGFSKGMSHLKSKVFLKAVRGVGIVRTGIPISFFCLFYALLEVLATRREKKNSDAVLRSIVTGILSGLVLRKITPKSFI